MWKKLDQETILKTSQLTVDEHKILLPGGKNIKYLYYPGVLDTVFIICKRENKYLFIEEYYYPLNKNLVSLPGGNQHKSEPVAKAAKREVLEECSVILNTCQEIGSFYSNPRRTKALTHIFVSDNNQDSTIPGKLDLEESISIKWLSIRQIDKLIATGGIIHQGTLASWLIYKNSNVYTRDNHHLPRNNK